MVVRRARITIETDTVMVVRHSRTAQGWCPGCQAEVEVITLDGASLAEPGASAQIQEWNRSGRLHFWQPPEGPPQICFPSLLQCFESGAIPKTRIAKEEQI